MNNKQKKIRINGINLFSILIVFLICLLSIGYGAMSGIALEVSGTTSAIPQDGIFISNVQETTSSNAIGKIISYYQNILNSEITLNEETSSITYTMQIYNNTNEVSSFLGVNYGNDFYDNKDITFKLDKLNIGDKISPGQTLTFTITFKYKNNLTEITKKVLKSNLQFEFSNTICNVTYSGDLTNTTEYPAVVGYAKDLKIIIDTELVETKVTLKDGTLVIPEIYYDSAENNYVLLVKNVKQDINVELYYFTRVDYLKGDGYAYIDTGYKPNQDTKVELDFEYLQQVNVVMMLFGARSADYTNAYTMFAHVPKTGTPIGEARSRVDLYNADNNKFHNISIGRHTFMKDGILNYIDGIQVSANKEVQFECPYSLYLFGVSTAGVDETQGEYAGGGRINFNGKIYSFKIYDNGTDLVRDFVPVYRDNDKEPGMYDIVNHKFYSNNQTSITSKFTYGYN